MDLTGEFVKSIKELVLEARNMSNRMLNIDGKLYTDTQFTPLKDPEPVALTVDTLTAIKDYLTNNPDGLSMAATIVIVEGPGVVKVLSCLTGNFKQRNCYLEAHRPRLLFSFGDYYSVEKFIIALQSQFLPSPIVDALLKIVGNITDGLVRTFEDNGVSQQVTAKAGIAKVENIPVPSPVILAPFRTFIDVAQPESNFILRMRSGDQQPACALFEADGGAWQLEAVQNIKGWLMDNLPEGVTILA